ncbi:hypothetical protein KIPB_004823 [Kipferlia bialata]|uniref:RING-type domain-containing protein n=1 Tax=Kipferlia bialata TaxID=797122 RepID=A0A9K3CUM0_9EUKA|nr:hypothetical protein KIPB_004823 [Kipferlia bialata]|eukprot:g4823.t1
MASQAVRPATVGASLERAAPLAGTQVSSTRTGGAHSRGEASVCVAHDEPTYIYERLIGKEGIRDRARPDIAFEVSGVVSTVVAEKAVVAVSCVSTNCEKQYGGVYTIHGPSRHFRPLPHPPTSILLSSQASSASGSGSGGANVCVVCGSDHAVMALDLSSLISMGDSEREGEREGEALAVAVETYPSSECVVSVTAVQGGRAVVVALSSGRLLRHDLRLSRVSSAMLGRRSHARSAHVSVRLGTGDALVPSFDSGRPFPLSGPILTVSGRGGTLLVATASAVSLLDAASARVQARIDLPQLSRGAPIHSRLSITWHGDCVFVVGYGDSVRVCYVPSADNRGTSDPLTQLVRRAVSGIRAGDEPQPVVLVSNVLLAEPHSWVVDVAVVGGHLAALTMPDIEHARQMQEQYRTVAEGEASCAVEADTDGEGESANSPPLSMPTSAQGEGGEGETEAEADREREREYVYGPDDCLPYLSLVVLSLLGQEMAADRIPLPLSVPLDMRGISLARIAHPSLQHMGLPAYRGGAARRDQLYLGVGPSLLSVSPVDIASHVQFLIEHGRYRQAVLAIAHSDRHGWAYESLRRLRHIEQVVDYLVRQGQFDRAASVLSAFIPTSAVDRWERWVYVFTARRALPSLLSTIPLPANPGDPQLSTRCYTAVLAGLLVSDETLFARCLLLWPSSLIETDVLRPAVQDRHRSSPMSDPLLTSLAILHERAGDLDKAFSYLLSVSRLTAHVSRSGDYSPFVFVRSHGTALYAAALDRVGRLFYIDPDRAASLFASIPEGHCAVTDVTAALLRSLVSISNGNLTGDNTLPDLDTKATADIAESLVCLSRPISSASIGTEGQRGQSPLASLDCAVQDALGQVPQLGAVISGWVPGETLTFTNKQFSYPLHAYFSALLDTDEGARRLAPCHDAAVLLGAIHDPRLESMKTLIVRCEQASAAVCERICEALGFKQLQAYVWKRTALRTGSVDEQQRSVEALVVAGSVTEAVDLVFEFTRHSPQTAEALWQHVVSVCLREGQGGILLRLSTERPLPISVVDVIKQMGHDASVPGFDGIVRSLCLSEAVHVLMYQSLAGLATDNTMHLFDSLKGAYALGRRVAADQRCLVCSQPMHAAPSSDADSEALCVFACGHVAHRSCLDTSAQVDEGEAETCPKCS